MSLAHFYHVYADGAWEKPVREHVSLLVKSGLMENLGYAAVGIVGKPENRRKVRNLLGWDFDIVAEANTGWEQVTIEKMHFYAQFSDDAILYAHTKGAYSNDALAKAWRESMTEDTVVRWREAVTALEKYDVAGPYWLKSDQPEHREHGFFFAGNFWWANSDYLAKLPPVKTEHRFQAEGWIGLGDPKAFVMRHGLSFWGNFAPLSVQP